MARVAAILNALYRAFRRDWKSFGSLGVNNFLPITVYFLQRAGAFLYLIVGLVLVFPMSADPMRKIPASRLALWPLDRRERWLLRVLSPWINPVTWLVVALAVWAISGRVTLGLWAVAAAVFAAGFALSDLSLPPGLAISGERFAVLTPSASSLPAFMCGIAIGVPTKLTLMIPAIKSCCAGPLPL